MWLVALSRAISVLCLAVQCFEEIILRKKGRWGGIHTQRVKTAWLAVKNPSVGLLLLLEAKLVIGNSHLTS